MIMAHPSECPGIQVRRATKRLYIGSYTTVESDERNEPGRPRSNDTIRSPFTVFRDTTYLPGWVEKTLYNASNDIWATDHEFTVSGVQKLVAFSWIHINGIESIDRVISLHGLIFNTPVVVLCIDIFGIFGTIKLSDSIDKNTSCTTGVVLGWGKNQYWIKSDPRKASAKRLRSLSLSMISLINVKRDFLLFFYREIICFFGILQ